MRDGWYPLLAGIVLLLIAIYGLVVGRNTTQDFFAGFVYVLQGIGNGILIFFGQQPIVDLSYSAWRTVVLIVIFLIAFLLIGIGVNSNESQ